MRFAPISLAATLAVSLSACAGQSNGGEESAAAASAARGHAIAQANCAQCHGIERTGSSPAPSAPLWRDLVLVRDVDGLAESFAEGSFVHSNGPVQMPEFTLAPAEIDDLLAYMKSLRSD